MATISTFISVQTMDKIRKGQTEQNKALLLIDAAGAAGILSTAAIMLLGDSFMLGSIVGIISAVWFAHLLVTGRTGNALLISITGRIGPLMASHADRCKMEKFTNTGNMLNTASYAISAIFMMSGLFNVSALVQNHYAQKDPLLQSAMEKVRIAKNTLANHQESAPKSNAEILADIGQHVAILTKIKIAQQQAIVANTSALAKWQMQVDAFWGKKHSSGQPGGNREIMDDNCNAKPSHFGGGLMKTAAENLCPQWRAIQAQRPTVNNPKINILKAKLIPLEVSINFRNTELALQNAVVDSLEILADTRTKIGLDNLPSNGVEIIIAFLRNFNPNINASLLISSIIIVLTLVFVFTNKFRNSVIPELENPRLLSNAEIATIMAIEKDIEKATQATWKNKFNTVLDFVRSIKNHVQTFSIKEKIGIITSLITFLLLSLFLVRSYAVAAPTNASVNLLFTTLVCLTGILSILFYLAWLFIKPMSNNEVSKPIVNVQPIALHEQNKPSDELFVNWKFVNKWAENLVAYQPLQNYSQNGQKKVKPENASFLVPTENESLCEWCKKPMNSKDNRRKYHTDCAKKVKNAKRRNRSVIV